MRALKIAATKANFFSKWAGYKAKAIRGTQEIQLWMLKVKLLPSLFAGINSALIMLPDGFSIMEGVMTAGIYVAFQNILEQFQEPFNKLILLGTTLQKTEMQMQRLDDVRRYKIDSLNYPDETKEKIFPSARLSGEFEKNISFGFSPLEPPLLENFNLKIEPGYWAAIVGSSGSGKSMLSKILAGLYEEWSDEILFDGVKRCDIPRHIIVNSLSSVDPNIIRLNGATMQKFRKEAEIFPAVSGNVWKLFALWQSIHRF